MPLEPLAPEPHGIGFGKPALNKCATSTGRRFGIGEVDCRPVRRIVQEYNTPHPVRGCHFVLQDIVNNPVGAESARLLHLLEHQQIASVPDVPHTVANAPAREKSLDGAHRRIVRKHEEPRHVLASRISERCEKLAERPRSEPLCFHPQQAGTLFSQSHVAK
jgi:hypothetical protein